MLLTFSHPETGRRRASANRSTGRWRARQESRRQALRKKPDWFLLLRYNILAYKQNLYQQMSNYDHHDKLQYCFHIAYFTQIYSCDMGLCLAHIQMDWETVLSIQFPCGVVDEMESWCSFNSFLVVTKAWWDERFTQCLPTSWVFSSSTRTSVRLLITKLTMIHLGFSGSLKPYHYQ